MILFFKPSPIKQGQTHGKEVNFVVMSLAENGEMFHQLSKYGEFPERIGRNFFQ